MQPPAISPPLAPPAATRPADAGKRAREKFLEARAALEAGEHLRAAMLLEDVVELLGRTPQRVLPLLVRALRGSKQYVRAHRELERYFSMQPDVGLVEYEEMSALRAPLGGEAAAQTQAFQTALSSKYDSARSYLSEYPRGALAGRVRQYLTTLPDYHIEQLGRDGLQRWIRDHIVGRGHPRCSPRVGCARMRTVIGYDGSGCEAWMAVRRTDIPIAERLGYYAPPGGFRRRYRGSYRRPPTHIVYRLNFASWQVRIQTYRTPSWKQQQLMRVFFQGRRGGQGLKLLFFPRLPLPSPCDRSCMEARIRMKMASRRYRPNAPVRWGRTSQVRLRFRQEPGRLLARAFGRLTRLCQKRRPRRFVFKRGRRSRRLRRIRRRRRFSFKRGRKKFSFKPRAWRRLRRRLRRRRIFRLRRHRLRRRLRQRRIFRIRRRPSQPAPKAPSQQTPEAEEAQ